MSYRPGQRVRIDAREHDGHHRTPAYVKGKTGTVERVHPTFPDPETRAYGSDGEPARRLYLVGFEMPELWPAYRGKRDDRLLVDLFEHWLKEAS